MCDGLPLLKRGAALQKVLMKRGATGFRACILLVVFSRFCSRELIRLVLGQQSDDLLRLRLGLNGSVFIWLGLDRPVFSVWSVCVCR